LPYPLPPGRSAAGSLQSSGEYRRASGGATQGDVAYEYSRAPSASGRAHQAQGRPRPGDRFPCQHPADPVRGEGRPENPGRSGRPGRHRPPRLRAGAEIRIPIRHSKALRHDSGNRTYGLGKDGFLVQRVGYPQPIGGQHLDGRGSGRNPGARYQPGQHERKDRTHLRGSAAGLSAPRPGYRHGRRDS